MSDLYQSLSHSKWDCKYHVVFVPKRRRKAVFGKLRRQLGEVFHALARQKECQILEGHLKTVNASPLGAHITLRKHDHSEGFFADRVINCTGPSMNYRRVSSTLLKNLFNRGLVTSGPLGAGFHCSQEGAIFDADGGTSEIIFNLGPGQD